MSFFLQSVHKHKYIGANLDRELRSVVFFEKTGLGNRAVSKMVGTGLEDRVGVVGQSNRCKMLHVLNSVAKWLAR